jgi:hypothetical protein
MWDAQDDYQRTVDAAQRKQKASKDAQPTATPDKAPTVKPEAKKAQKAATPVTQEKKTASTVHGMSRKRTNDDYIRGGDIAAI